MEAIREAIYVVLKEDHPQSVRHVFYCLVSMPEPLIRKTEQECKGTVGRLLVQMRESGDVPFDWITDNTRWMRKPDSFDSLEDALHATAALYRRNVWADLDVKVEVWCESDSIAGVLYQETAEWDVPLMATRGQSSVTFAYESAQEILRVGKPTFIYYVGDYDPWGKGISRVLEEKLRRYAPGADIVFESVAVNYDQIRRLKLPTRPSKAAHNVKKQDRTKISVEAEAIPATTLREIIRDRILEHIPDNHLRVLLAAEKSEREILLRLDPKRLNGSGRPIVKKKARKKTTGRRRES